VARHGMCELTHGMAGDRHGRGMLCVNRPLLSAKGNTAQTHASCQTLHSFVNQALSRGNVPFGMCISYIDKCICSREPRTRRAHFNVEEECENLFSRSSVWGFLLDLSGRGHGPLSVSQQ
jgi:hypothetical protein